MTIQLTRRELDVMSVVWELGSATVGEVLAKLGENLAYTTILTVLRTLETKGAVRHEKDGKAYRYYALVESEHVGDGTINRLLDKVYQGSREMLIARLVEDEGLSPQELKRIRRLLDRRLKEMDA
jgi:predicted transcriptional regulator